MIVIQGRRVGAGLAREDLDLTAATVIPSAMAISFVEHSRVC